MVLIVIFFSVFSGFYIIILVKDREKRVRHVLKVVGVETFAYLMGNLIADCFLFFISTGIFIILLYPLGLSLVYNDWTTVLAIFASFGFALITLTYLASFLFDDAECALYTMASCYVIVGIVLLGLYWYFSVIADEYYTWWIYGLLIDPFWALAHSLMYCYLY